MNDDILEKCLKKKRLKYVFFFGNIHFFYVDMSETKDHCYVMSLRLLMMMMMILEPWLANKYENLYQINILFERTQMLDDSGVSIYLFIYTKGIISYKKNIHLAGTAYCINFYSVP